MITPRAVELVADPERPTTVPYIVANIKNTTQTLKKLATQGLFDLSGSGPDLFGPDCFHHSPAEFRTLIADEVVRWREVAKAAGIEPQ